jgi:hypothetical protein
MGHVVDPVAIAVAMAEAAATTEVMVAAAMASTRRAGAGTTTIAIATANRVTGPGNGVVSNRKGRSRPTRPRKRSNLLCLQRLNPLGHRIRAMPVTTVSGTGHVGSVHLQGSHTTVEELELGGARKTGKRDIVTEGSGAVKSGHTEEQCRCEEASTHHRGEGVHCRCEEASTHHRGEGVHCA